MDGTNPSQCRKYVYVFVGNVTFADGEVTLIEFKVICLEKWM